MSAKLSFEDWKADTDISVSPDAIEALRIYHGIDDNKQVDIMLQSMYNNYLLKYLPEDINMT